MTNERLENAEASELGRRLNALRKTRAGGRPRKIRKCKGCGAKLSAREMWVHRCPAREVK